MLVKSVQGSKYKSFLITKPGTNSATYTSPHGENAFEMFDGMYHWRWQRLKIVWKCVFNMHDPSFQRWAQTGESIIPFENAALVLWDKYLLQPPVKHNAAVIPRFCVTCCKYAAVFLKYLWIIFFGFLINELHI